MTRRLQIALLVLVPVAVLVLLFWVDRTFGFAGRGRDYVIRLELPPPAGEVGLPKIEGPLDPSRPLVVIDAGHGGFDPGAGSGPTKEKEITLALARRLRDELLKGGGVRVALTRADDRFLVLEERAGIARRLKADLFISIHADAAPNEEARGGTVYVLSEKGSSQTAAALAEKENRVNVVNGVALSDQSDDVANILVDLAQRETVAQSEDFAALILREGRGLLHFRDSAIQSAAFIVLKSADLPSVLFEAGYITSPEDAAWLASRDGQASFATATANAIRVYFARHRPG
ncbi:N-acetylmuramoyl-L-alanine amidase [Novosphingobium sp. TH158]|uniref:N-acetylmuramoyl-L-alanine amidase family protein n=1 Tax=Novosphingobium sp. TH158 TaxID=2067455 RepID=UPI000C7C2631|nr:N-acetylmuramoyl-L-alanine amidase [Novosphingobium sp. TH158]PLK25785.1 N-acetylmuramoyl-L-alanine amidase [Novosphingobium sp. TH158]